MSIIKYQWSRVERPVFTLWSFLTLPLPPPPLSFLLLFSILWTLIRGAYVGGRTHHAAYGTCQKLALQQCPRSGGPLAEVNRSTAGLQGPVRQFSTGLLRIAREISHPMAWNPCARSVRLIEFFHFLFLGNDNVLPPIFQPFNRTWNFSKERMILILIPFSFEGTIFFSLFFSRE